MPIGFLKVRSRPAVVPCNMVTSGFSVSLAEISSGAHSNCGAASVSAVSAGSNCSWVACSASALLVLVHSWKLLHEVLCSLTGPPQDLGNIELTSGFALDRMAQSGASQAQASKVSAFLSSADGLASSTLRLQRRGVQGQALLTVVNLLRKMNLHVQFHAGIIFGWLSQQAPYPDFAWEWKCVQQNDASICSNSSISATKMSPFQILTACNAHPRNIPGDTFLPNW